jgi:MFS family permease
MEHDNHAFVSVEQSLEWKRRTNLYLTVGLLSFTTMMFHFTTVFFFTLQLQSLALVWAFLGLWNLFAFLFDVPIGILQYYFKPKKLYLFWVISQVVAMLIFANFIFSVTDFIAESAAENTGALEWIVRFFLLDGLNIILMIVAAACYGFTKEVNDITSISYVMNNANPSQYKDIIAKNNLVFGIGSFFGLLTAGFILSSDSPKLIVINILFIIISLFLLAYYFFDNTEKTLELKDVKKFQVYFRAGGIEKVRENIAQVVSTIDLKTTLLGTRYIFLKPMTLSPTNISWDELILKTRESFIDTYETLRFASRTHLIVYWAFIMVLTFGFWDTFASTFLIDFLNQLKPGWSYILLWAIAIPAYGLQGVFGKLGDKIGIYKIASIWLLLSGGSLVLMWFFAENSHFSIVMILALINSVGYAICMGLSVATFLETYNKSYAERKNLKQVDANASAAPMKILQNMANVVGLFLGWLILSLFSFSGFFFLFWLGILGFFVWSILNAGKIKGEK